MKVIPEGGKGMEPGGEWRMEMRVERRPVWWGRGDAEWLRDHAV